MENIICFIIFYVLPVIINWFYFRLGFGKNGKSEGMKIDNVVFLFMFVPLLNLLFSVLGWLLYYPLKRRNKEKSFYKFFLLNDKNENNNK